MTELSGQPDTIAEQFSWERKTKQLDMIIFLVVWPTFNFLLVTTSLYYLNFLEMGLVVTAALKIW